MLGMQLSGRHLPSICETRGSTPRKKKNYTYVSDKSMSTFLSVRFQDSQTQKFVGKFKEITLGGKVSIEMISYLKYLFNPPSVNADSDCCRNSNIFDHELLAQLLLSYYVQHRDHSTYLKVKTNPVNLPKHTIFKNFT